MQAIRKQKLRTTVRDIYFCKREDIYLVVGYGVVQIFYADIENPHQTVHFSESIRLAGFSLCGNYFFVVDFNYVLYIYDTQTATILQKIYGLNNSIKDVKFSQNFSRLLYGNSQLLCLWDLRKNSPLMRTQHWRNINCYDLNIKGNQFAVGTYNGSIYMMEFLEIGKCNQIELKKHKNCVMCVCFHEDKLISYGHGGSLVIAAFEKSGSERVVKYSEVKLLNAPRSIQSVGSNFYLFDRTGMSWFNKYNKLIGFTDNLRYHVVQNEQGETIVIKQGNGQLEWWPISAFRSKQQILMDSYKQNISNNSTLNSSSGSLKRYIVTNRPKN